MNTVNEKLQKSCQSALSAFQKLKSNDNIEIQKKLEWCLGSYKYDKNASGLNEFGIKSLDILKGIKTKHPRKVTKKVIDDLTRAIKNYSKN